MKAARSVIVRIPPVLSVSGGAYPPMRLPASLGAGASFGSGRQIFPWIHEEDMAAVLYSALFSESFSGVVNAVCTESEQRSHQEFTAALCKRYALSLLPFFFLNASLPV